MITWMSGLLALVCVLALTACSGEVSSAEETVSFHDMVFNKAYLSQETLEWLEWYNKLDENEQLAISYIPSDLYELLDYDNRKDAPVETE